MFAACLTAGIDGLVGCPQPVINTVNSFPLEIVLPVLITPFVLALIIFGVTVLVRRWRRMRSSNKSLTTRLLSTQREMIQAQDVVQSMKKVWEVSWDEMHTSDTLGTGAFGNVLRGQWRGMSVAVKILTAMYMESEELRQEMDREATMLQTLRHAHVVQFLGAGMTDEDMPFIVTELMELGSLTSILQGEMVCIVAVLCHDMMPYYNTRNMACRSQVRVCPPSQ